MLKNWLVLLILIALPTPTVVFANETVGKTLFVVVNASSSITQLSQKQVIGFFLGRSKFLPNGSKVKTIDFPLNSDARAAFYQALTGKNIADIDAYWARLAYSGRAFPPRPLSDVDQAIEMVAEREDTIAYLPEKYLEPAVKNGLKTVFTIPVN